MEDQENESVKDKQPDIRSRPGTFGYTAAKVIPSIVKDDLNESETYDEDECKRNSKSALEKLLEEEERRQGLSRESSGTIIYDYEEPQTPFPHSLEVQEDESVDSIASRTVHPQTIGEGEPQVSGSFSDEVPNAETDEGNQSIFISESYIYDPSHHDDDDNDDSGIQSEAVSTATENQTISIGQLCDNKTSLEIFPSLADSAVTAPEQTNTNDNETMQVTTTKKKKSSFLWKLFHMNKK